MAQGPGRKWNGLDTGFRGDADVGSAGRFAASETIGGQVFTREIASGGSGDCSRPKRWRRLGGRSEPPRTTRGRRAHGLGRRRDTVEGWAVAAAAGFALMGIGTLRMRSSRGPQSPPTEKTIAQSVSGLYMTRALRSRSL